MAPELNLLSELTQSKPPDFDPTEVIGASFIRVNSANDPSKVTVIEVDPDDGRVLLEYANSELEWVEPNIVQEALLSRGDQGSEFFSFSKILNHRTCLLYTSPSPRDS